MIVVPFISATHQAQEVERQWTGADFIKDSNGQAPKGLRLMDAHPLSRVEVEADFLKSVFNFNR